MKNTKYTIFKAFNKLRLLYNRPSMLRGLKELQNYHLGTKKSDYTNIKENLLNEILTYSQNNCPYYKELYKTVGITSPSIGDLNRIPFLDKQIIRLNYKDLQSKESKRLTNYIMKSGGTTGSPLIFPGSSHYQYEHNKFAFELFGYQKGDDIVSIDGTGISKDKIEQDIFWKKRSTANLPYGKISFSSIYLNNTTAKFYIQHLNKLKPSFIRGYPSAINFLSLYIIENNLKLDFKLKAVYLTAETIFTSHIEAIKKAFNTPLSLEYGHSEVSVFAYTIDESYEYYCSPYYGYTEVIGTDGNHVEIGEIGEVVVTGFYNKSMPFIRYKTGDLALFNGNKDGLTRLLRIDGRTQDFLIDKNGEKTFLVGSISSMTNSFIDHIKKWQIVQNKPGLVEIKIIKSDSFTSADESSIIRFFTKKKGVTPTIIYVDNIEVTSRGKNKLVVQNIAI